MDYLVAQLRAQPIRLETTADVCEKGSSYGPPDEQVLERICVGDMEALAVLFRRYSRVAHQIGRRILRDSVEAEDFVQDLFLYIYRKCGVYDGTKGPASSWIVQTIYYQALQRRIQLAVHNRHSHVMSENSECLPLASPASTEYEQTLEGIVGRTRLRDIRNCLTDDQWETLRLHFFEGYTLSEIARKKEQSLGNIRHHFYRGLEKLRSHVFRSELQDRITSGTR